MSTESNNDPSQPPQWMRDMFEELRGMFEGSFPDADELIGLFPDADNLNLEEMQRHLNKQHTLSSQ